MTRDISLFPIGTVVILHDSTAAVMIAGYLAESDQKPGYTWDYSGFLYPIGLRDERKVYTFDHTQIEQVLAIGYQDGESFAFLKKIRMVAAKMAEQEEILENNKTGKQQEEFLNEDEVDVNQELLEEDMVTEAEGVLKEEETDGQEELQELQEDDS